MQNVYIYVQIHICIIYIFIDSVNNLFLDLHDCFSSFQFCSLGECVRIKNINETFSRLESEMSLFCPSLQGVQQPGVPEEMKSHFKTRDLGRNILPARRGHSCPMRNELTGWFTVF